MGRHVFSAEKVREMRQRADAAQLRLEALCERMGWARPEVEVAASGGSPAVYFVSCDDGKLVKIGTSRHFPQRLASLRSVIPWPLTVEAVVPGGVECERRLHRLFAEERWVGEWFKRSDDLQELIEFLQQELGVPSLS